MLSFHGEAIYRGDTPLLLIVNHNGAQFFVTFTHDYNEKCSMISKGNLEDFNTYIFWDASVVRVLFLRPTCFHDKSLSWKIEGGISLFSSILEILQIKEAWNVQIYSYALICCLPLQILAGPKVENVGECNNPIECLDLHLIEITITEYRGTTLEIKFARLFVEKARLLKVMRFPYIYYAEVNGLLKSAVVYSWMEKALHKLNFSS